MLQSIKNFLVEEDGLSAVEYAIAGALVIGIAAGAFSTLGTNVNDQIDTLANCAAGDCNSAAAQ